MAENTPGPRIQHGQDIFETDDCFVRINTVWTHRLEFYSVEQDPAEPWSER